MHLTSRNGLHIRKLRIIRTTVERRPNVESAVQSIDRAQHHNMDRVVISKRVLDRLIRAKVEMVDDCAGVNALPVVVKTTAQTRGCNWMIPGWTGDQEFVSRCNRKIRNYLEFLRAQFNVSD